MTTNYNTTSTNSTQNISVTNVVFDSKNIDPLKDNGDRFTPFDISAVYPVPRSKQETVIHQLYNTLIAKIENGHINESHNKISKAAVTFEDKGVVESPRFYLVIQGFTPRSTKMTIFVLFRQYGDYLYISTSSFLNIIPLKTDTKNDLWKRMVPFIILMVLGFIISGVLASISRNASPFVIFGGTLIIGFLALQSIKNSLRQEKKRVEAKDLLDTLASSSSTFNTDDIIVFYKSCMTMIINSTQKVFRENNLEDAFPGLTQIINNTNYFASTIGSINQSGGDVKVSNS